MHAAIAEGYPEAQRHKLYLRLAKSYLRLGLNARARPALLIAKNLLREHGEPKESEVKEMPWISPWAVQVDQHKKKLEVCTARRQKLPQTGKVVTKAGKASTPCAPSVR